MTTTFELGDLRVHRGETIVIEGQTISGNDCDGECTQYEVVGPDELDLVVGDIRWASGERDIRTVARGSSPHRYDRLCHGLRLGVLHHGWTDFVELRQARMKVGEWSNLFQATLLELDLGAGINVERRLHELGCVAVGSRREVLVDAGRRRNYLCCTFPRNAETPPLAAYVLTRVAPLVHGVTVSA